MTVHKSIIMQDSDIKDAILRYLYDKGVEGFTSDDIKFESKEMGQDWVVIDRIHVSIEHEDEI